MLSCVCVRIILRAPISPIFPQLSLSLASSLVSSHPPPPGFWADVIFTPTGFRTDPFSSPSPLEFRANLKLGPQHIITKLNKNFDKNKYIELNMCRLIEIS